MTEITFRDFAGALMADDHELASRHLETLLGVDAGTATAATAHFADQMKSNPAFMMKAMGMREAVESGAREPLVALLSDCFALSDEVSGAAADTILSGARAR